MALSQRTKFLAVVLFGLILFNLYPYLKKPSNDLFIGIHKQGYENSFIQFIENGLVQIQTVDTRSVIVFRPSHRSLKRFRLGYIAPVTFSCVKVMDNKCDLSRPYKLYVSSVLVELIEMRQ